MNYKQLDGDHYSIARDAFCEFCGHGDRDHDDEFDNCKVEDCRCEQYITPEELL